MCRSVGLPSSHPFALYVGGQNFSRPPGSRALVMYRGTAQKNVADIKCTEDYPTCDDRHRRPCQFENFPHYLTMSIRMRIIYTSHPDPCYAHLFRLPDPIPHVSDMWQTDQDMKQVSMKPHASVASVYGTRQGALR